MYAALFLLACASEPPPTPGKAPLRVGWQTTWATQGQLAITLLEKQLFEAQGFEPRFVGFPYGGPLNEGALAGEVDLVFTADQPALTLASRAPQWGIIGRLMTNRVGLLVPPDSPITRPAELKGRRLAVPFGAAAQREAIAALRADGQDPAGVEVVNLGLPELQGLVNAGSTAGRWGETAAVAVWDPTLSDLELQGRARLLTQAKVTSLILLNDGYAAEHPGAPEKLLAAIGQAWRIYAQDPAAADAAFLKATALSLHPQALSRAASVEPNLSGPPRLHLNEAEIAGLEGAARFMHEVGLLASPLDLGAALRPSARQR